MKEAMLYEKLEDNRVRCNLCAHRCVIKEGKRGVCLVRENQNGTLYTLVYGRTISQAVDPVEKKPLFNFYPGTTAFSIATVGCNFRCDFCQNWSISQVVRDEHLIMGQETTPERLVATAKRYNSRSIAYTYTEPTIFFELALETSRLATRAGLRNVFVTNGYLTKEALALLAATLHAANVDLKSFSDRYYRKVCGATLAPVLASIRELRALGIWVEVTTLLVPGHNDTDAELRALTRWLASVDPDMPWHVSAFFPAYRMTEVPPTPPEALDRAVRIGRQAGLRYVYTGNVPDETRESTACPRCGRWLIRRRGFRVLDNALRAGRCPACATAIPGVWA